MATQAIFRPEAEDIQLSDVVPTRELEDCNHLLDDHAALQRFYEANGYILLRNVLDPASVVQARDAMLAAAVKLGIAAPGDPLGKWTGVPYAGGKEETEIYSGIAPTLLEHPANAAVLEKVLGEPACTVPMVQYRTYPPDVRLAPVHQDGFYSPGIDEYKPVWITLTECPREVGGLRIAVGQNTRGMLHNAGKAGSYYPIPKDEIPADSWATTDFHPGDVLIVHPLAPHCAANNSTDRLRVTFDARVQSAKNPTALLSTIVSADTNSITVDCALGRRTFAVDDETFIRVASPGARETRSDLPTSAKPGLQIVVVREGDRATMLRRASAG